MPEWRQQHGLRWNDKTTPLQVEFKFIRGDGYVEHQGQRYGKGKFHHYREAQRLLWPEDDHHRWSDLMLRRKCENDIVVMMGSSDSNKTYATARYVLTDYWAHPDNTLWMASSTEMRGAELRIWGKMKELFNRARALHPWLAGRILENRSCITTEEVSQDGSEGRLLTKGVIFIPCKRAEGWVGMGSYCGVKPSKNGRLGHAGDECFPSGTWINTPSGYRPIECLCPGDSIISAAGPDRVIGIRTRQWTKAWIKISLFDGRDIICTPDHPFLTLNGWRKACEIDESSYLLSPHEALQTMRDPTPKQEFLQSLLLGEIRHHKSSGSEKFLFCRAQSKNRTQQNAVARGASITQSGNYEGDAQPFGTKGTTSPEAHQRSAQANRSQAKNSRRQWDRANEGRDRLDRNAARGGLELRHTHRQMERKWLSPDLQSGLRSAGDQTRHRSRWKLPLLIQSEVKRPKETGISCGSWVDRVEVLKPSYFRCSHFGSSTEGYTVYNLEVEKHPSYGVNGLLAHNCSFMERSFLQAYANWVGKENFQGILDGNPTDIEDPLCTAAEPVEGWAEWEDNGKTQEWRSKWYGAWVIAFDGRDSPNFDPPLGGRLRYPYLIGPKKLKAVGETEGIDSPLYWMQCVGKPLPGASSLKVITRQDCENGGAFEKVVWEGSTITEVVSLDAAYGGVGGDRCIVFRIRFGRDVEGKDVIACSPPVQVPVSVKHLEDPETQIARFCKRYCEGFSIPPSHFYFDGRATLALKLANVWSEEVNVVDFGGPATDRPVSENEYVWDGDEKTRRLKRCNEHYSKFVTELWFSVRYLIVGKQMRELPRPVAEEGFRRLWHPTKGSPPRIEVETKLEMKERVTFSPDLFDALVIAVEGARRLGFHIKNLREGKAAEEEEAGWLEQAAQKWKRTRERRELKFA